MSEQLFQQEQPMTIEPPVVDAAPAESGLAVMDPTPLGGLAPAQSVGLLPVPQMEMVLTEYDARRRTFRRWLLSQMTEGVHFGYPPGVRLGNADAKQWTNKPSLYKAGAQMCVDLLMMRPEWAADEGAWKQIGSPVGQFVFACRLINLGGPFFAHRAVGEVLGEGRGIFGVDEKKMGPNSAIKMAEKRALVDAVMNTLGLADLFTQDLDDPPPGDAPEKHPDAPKVGTRAQRRQRDATWETNPDTTNAVLNAFDSWKHVRGVDDWNAFTAFAKSHLKSPATMGEPGDWTLESAKKVNAALLAEVDQ